MSTYWLSITLDDAMRNHKTHKSGLLLKIGENLFLFSSWKVVGWICQCVCFMPVHSRITTASTLGILLLMNEVSTLTDVGSNKGITILHWNARSIFNKFPEIGHILNASKCEIAIFGESWLTDSITDQMLDLRDREVNKRN